MWSAFDERNDATPYCDGAPPLRELQRVVHGIVAGTAAPAAEPAPPDETAPVRPSVEQRSGLPETETSEAAYQQLRIDWRRHVGRAERAGISPFDLDGAAELIRRVGEFAGKEDLPAEPRRQLRDLVGRYNRHVEDGARVEACRNPAATRPSAATRGRRPVAGS